MLSRTFGIVPRALGRYALPSVSVSQSGRGQARWSTSKPELMSHSEAFVETMVAHGTQDVFGIVGSAFMDALDLFPLADIRFISVQHEQNAAHMADGYSRVTNRHGVCIAQNGPGITNFVTGIAAAYWAHSPVVAITPEAATSSKGLGGFQETDQLPIFEPITKFQAHINNPSRISELTGRAYDIAMNERGPVQINIPRDHLYGDSNIKIATPHRLDRGAGGAEALDKAVEALQNASRPVLLVGGGTVMGNASQQVVELANTLQCPVATTYLHNDAFPASHPLMCGPLGYQGSMAAMKSVNEADVVLALGTRLSPFGTNPQYGFDYWPKDATLIQVEADSRRLSLVQDADVMLHADAGACARELTARLQSSGLRSASTREERLQTLQKHKDEWNNLLTEWSTENEVVPGLMKPRAALTALERGLQTANNPVVSTDIGNVCSVANSYLRFEQPKSFLAAMTFGNCGYAVPAAMGARVGLDREGGEFRPVVAYVGDGAYGMSLNEILTCNREDIPVTVVVFNNQQWGAEKKNQVLWFGDRYVGVNLKNPSFAEIGRSMGVEGIRVDRVEDVAEALESAMAAQKQRKTTIVELMLTRELGDPFRRDAMRLPVRRLAKYSSTTEVAESETGQPIDMIK